MLQAGTVVKVKSQNVLGEVMEDGLIDYTDGKNYYWVKYLNKLDIVVYSEDDLTPVYCTCGAKATYAPKLPPGHSFHCDLRVD